MLIKRFGVMDMFNLGFTLTLVMLGTMMLGILGGVLGTLLVLRRQALLGDALSHATLPGVMLAFMIFSTRSLEVLLLGALLSASLAYVFMMLIKRHTVLQWDAAMALILAGFFGFGQWLLSVIQRQGSASQAGLSRFIFGQAATMLREDVIRLSVVSVILLFIIIMCLKEFKATVFDPVFFSSMGRSSKKIEWLLSIMTLVFIILGIRLVGVVLISALLIAPVLSAQQWTNRFHKVILLAALIGGISGLVGTYISAIHANVPTGPVIVFVLGVFFLISIFFAPKEGLLRRTYEWRRLKRMIHVYAPLIHLYEQPHDQSHAEDLVRYEHQGYLIKQGHLWQLTPKGEDKVKALKRVILDES